MTPTRIIFSAALLLGSVRPHQPHDRLFANVSVPANGCGFWDPLGACNAAETAARKLLDAVPGITDEVEDAALNVVDEFMNKLGGVIEKAEAAVLRIEKQSVQNAEALWENVTRVLMSTIDKIVDTVQRLISKSVATITAAIEKVISDVSHLVDTIFNRLETALHTFEEFIWASVWYAIPLFCFSVASGTPFRLSVSSAFCVCS